jgi:hypothetical protein
VYTAYTMLGEDPWISETPEDTPSFSAWKYARKRSREICGSGAIHADPEGAP